RDDVLAGYRAAEARGARMCDADVTAVREPLRARLAREREVAVGMGVIVAPGLLADRPLRMEWWQTEAGTAAMLEVDLNPASVGFYDYAAAEWFVVPRRTGRRHVVGPYVDVHGTDRYLLTLTLPVLADGEFVGVVGADVPVARFETLVLRELGDLAADVVVVNPEDRVVLSTSPRWLAGERAELTGVSCRTLDEPDWRVAVV
ncbi:cache domain-containing protein, partial [Pseudonocardia pini]|uniref:cache domain-containing protein n=1 Tax=Pseudonocardia pini TaxID=2758030 RepID=UPI0015F009BF